MEVPKYWRNRATYLGTADGGLEGSRCPICGALSFPSREGTICPNCHWYSGQSVEIQKNLGVGVLLFAEVNGVLNLVLFKDICNEIADQDGRKKERIAQSNYTLSNTDSFSVPKGLNTVTGKVEIDAVDQKDVLDANSVVDAQLVYLLTQSIQREIEEEAGVSLSTESLHLLTQSQVEIDQFRGHRNEKNQPIIHHFVIYAFAALLSKDELAILQKQDARTIELFDVNNLDELQKCEVRKATQAILTFLSTALLFLGRSETQTKVLGGEEATESAYLESKRKLN